MLLQGPGNYSNTPCNKEELARLVTHFAFRRIAGFGNGMCLPTSVVFVN